jgi:hypothetical protein
VDEGSLLSPFVMHFSFSAWDRFVSELDNSLIKT